MTTSRKIGDREVYPIGFGPMRLSLEGHPDETQAIHTIHAALDAGATFIDTADVYCAHPDEMGHNERLIAKALSAWSGDKSNLLIATKGGHTRTVDKPWVQDGRPQHLRTACEASLKALGVETIDLYQYHSPDPNVPFEDAIGTLKDLRTEGKIRMVGLSNVGRRLISQAQSIVEIVSVQNQFSPLVRESSGVIPFCADQNIAFLCWSPLGQIEAPKLPTAVPALAEIAAEHSVSSQQVALAWELAQDPCIIPIPGATRTETARDSLAAASLQLTTDEITRLDST